MSTILHLRGRDKFRPLPITGGLMDIPADVAPPGELQLRPPSAAGQCRPRRTPGFHRRPRRAELRLNLTSVCARVAAGLRALGLKREERVLLLMLDDTHWPVAFLGAIYAGVVPVAVNTLLTADDYAYMLEHSRAQAALVSGALLPTLNSALIKSDHEVQRVIVSHPAAPPQPVGDRLRGLRRRPGAVEANRPPRRPTTRVSGSIRRAPPAAPRARCIRTPTPTGRPSCTASACSG